MTSPAARVERREHVWRGLFLLGSAGVVWGTIGPAVHLVHERSGLSVLTTGAYRAVAAVAVLLLAARLTGRLTTCRSSVRRHGRRVVAVGVLAASFQLLFFAAVVTAGVSVATVVALGFPPVLLLAVVSARRRRRPSGVQLLTVAAAVVGLALVGLAGGTGGGPYAALGLLAALGSGAAYAFGADLGAPLSQRYDALAVTTVTMTVAATVLVPVGLVVPLVAGGRVTTDDGPSWLLVAYLGVVTMAFAYVLLFAGLRSTPSGAAVVATLLEPVTAVAIAVAFLGEALTVPALAGCGLILAAVTSLGLQGEEPPPQ